MIRPAADRGLCVPALPGPCSHHGAQDREAANSLDGFHAAPSQRHFRSFKFLDRQVLFTGIPAVPAAGNRRRVNLRKKTRERTRPCGASSGFSCLCSSRLSCFRRAALGARLLSLQSHFKWEQAHSAYLSQTGAQANYSLKKFRAGH